jgi:hypothetical protein
MWAIEAYFAPLAADGIYILEVDESQNLTVGPNGFGVHFLVAQPHRAGLVLCGVATPATAAHEIGHPLHLNHIDAAGDRTGFTPSSTARA